MATPSHVCRVRNGGADLMLLAENANVIAAAFAFGATFGASIVLLTIWMLHAMEHKGERKYP